MCVNVNTLRIGAYELRYSYIIINLAVFSYYGESVSTCFFVIYVINDTYTNKSENILVTLGQVTTFGESHISQSQIHSEILSDISQSQT